MRVLIFLDFEKGKTLGRPAPLRIRGLETWERHTPNPAVRGSHITDIRKGFWMVQWLLNRPSNTGDASLIPGLGELRSHLCQGN